MYRLIMNAAGKKGSEMVEAAVSLPVIILAAMLMIRMFTFYLEILTTEVKMHKEALSRQDGYNGLVFRTHNEEKKITLLKGGLLLFDAHKTVRVKTYLINEDYLVRSGELAGE